MAGRASTTCSVEGHFLLQLKSLVSDQLFNHLLKILKVHSQRLVEAQRSVFAGLYHASGLGEGR